MYRSVKCSQHQLVQPPLDRVAGLLQRLWLPLDPLLVVLLDSEKQQLQRQQEEILALELVVCGGSTQTILLESKCK